MTTITKERLLTIKQWRETYGPDSNIVLPAEEAEELAQIALASLEVDPVAWKVAFTQIDRKYNTFTGMYSDKSEVERWVRLHKACNFRADITPLYTAPPVPVVPEEKPMPNALSMLEREITQLIGDAQEATVTGYELIAEAWRLMDGQDPKTSDWHSKASKYLNSNIVEKVDDDRIDAIKAVLRRLAGNYPVTPDGWISCSERMPNDKQYVWCWGKSYGWTECDTFEGYYDWSRNKWWAITDDGEEPASKVTHWMPLPEPPQEAK